MPKRSAKDLRPNHSLYPPPTYHMPLAKYHQPTPYEVAESSSTLICLWCGVIYHKHKQKRKIKETKIKTATGRGHEAPDLFLFSRKG